METEDRLLSAIETERDPQRRQFLRDLFLDNVDQLQDANLLTAEDAAKRKLSFSDRADEVVKTGLFEQRAATLTAVKGFDASIRRTRSAGTAPSSAKTSSGSNAG